MAGQHPDQREDMTDQEIRSVFEMLKLPTTPVAPPQVQQPSIPVIVFPIGGDSPPLNPR
ncbi:MAG: hypothetical protein LC808_39675 [Actinobacteria bacterium]|nr:hypothetical protein [Actinomycetota bacterium]